MPRARPTKLAQLVDLRRDHVLGHPEAEITLVECGNYARRSCHVAQPVAALSLKRLHPQMPQQSTR
jgi:NhaA family Na+:H+ antiporter